MVTEEGGEPFLLQAKHGNFQKNNNFSSKLRFSFLLTLPTASMVHVGWAVPLIPERNLE
jgi:hypothetical protein